MKKMLFAMTAVLFMASCGAPSEQAVSDSTVVVDSSAVADSAQVADSSVLATDPTTAEIPAQNPTSDAQLGEAKDENQGGNATHGQPIK